ncbi:MAG: hypothetical protein E2600_07270 [Chryseobacterium sp.]|nr:hypothetical protein [Chryseobacterium sp.]
MKNRHKGINAILAISVLYCSVGMAFAQAGPTGIGTRNPQGPLHIDGAKDNDATAPALPTSAQATNDVIVDKTTGFIGVGTLTPKVKLDMRSAPGTNSENALGLGTTAMLASAAGAGAVRYDSATPPGTGPAMDVSDDVTWKRVYVAPKKAVVVARKITSQTIQRGVATDIVNWSELNSSPSFDPIFGIFTAPRTGTYTFLLTFDFASTTINDASLVESQFFNLTTNTVLARVYKTFGQSMNGSNAAGEDGGASRPTQAGGSSTVTLNLAAGTRVVARLYHTLITTGGVALRVTTNSSDPANPDDGFNNLTIIEH